MDKRTLETILADQAEELVLKQTLHFCQRKEEDKIDLKSTQAQVVIGVRRSGKSTLCYNALTRKKVKFAYVNFDDERLIHLRVCLNFYSDFYRQFYRAFRALERGE